MEATTYTAVERALTGENKGVTEVGMSFGVTRISVRGSRVRPTAVKHQHLCLQPCDFGSYLKTND